MGLMVLAVVLIAAVVGMAVVICRDSRRFVTVEYRICSKKLKKKVKIALLSDLHNKSYGRDNEELLKAIDEAAPDMVVIAGDMLTANEERTSYTVPISLIKRLTAKYPVYYGNGNHEYRMKMYREGYGRLYDDYAGQLRKCGVRLLENERVYLPETNMEIFGLEIEKPYYKRLRRKPMADDYIRSRIGRNEEGRFSLLIAHNPDYFENYAGWGADLTVSGHVHGGVMRLPVLGGVISPMFHLFPKYDGGLFEEYGKRLILSRGLGMHTIPLRIFNPGELVLIDLRPE